MLHVTPFSGSAPETPVPQDFPWNSIFSIPQSKSSTKHSYCSPRSRLAGLTTPQSMKHPEQYEPLLWGAYSVVCLLVLTTGWVGYLAFGAGTKSIIVLNLPTDWAATKVIQVSLMVSRFLQ